MMLGVARRKWREMARLTTAGKLIWSQQRGFSYLAMLFIVAVLSVVLTQTYQRSDTIAKREKEKELYFVGQQYKQALTSYYNQSPNGLNQLPRKIEDLLSDSRFVVTKRHLRKQYLDPITGGELQLILDGDARIKGVYSRSNAAILQLALFEEDAQKIPAAGKALLRVYSDIKFEYEQQSNVEDSADAEDLGSEASNDILESF